MPPCSLLRTSLATAWGSARRQYETHAFCIDDGPTPEAIRKTAAGNDLPADRITQARVLDLHFYTGEGA